MYCRIPETRTLRGNEKQFELASYRGRLKNLIYHVAVFFGQGKGILVRNGEEF